MYEKALGRNQLLFSLVAADDGLLGGEPHIRQDTKIR